MSYRSDVEFPGYYLDDESEPLMVGEHDSLKKLYKDIDAYKGSDQNVLVVAETGTGKSLVAHALHHNSPRKDNKYITIDLSNIPEGLIESEMFGSRKGAFTGAADKKGLLEDLKYGTAFLDEIGELPRHLQAKLMRALEVKRARRVGAVNEYDLDVRFIAATSTPRQELRNRDVFHPALFYRLNVLPINIPPLRERGEDIGLLIKYFSYKYNKEELKNVQFDDDARKILNSYKWPGNIRELSGVVRRLVTRYDVVNKEALEMEDEFSGKNDRPYELKDSASPNPEIDNTNPAYIEKKLAAFEKRLMDADAPRNTGESGSKTYSITLSDDLIDLIGSSKERVADRVSNLIRGEKSVEDTTEYKELTSKLEEIDSKYSKILKFFEETSSDKQKYTKEFKELQEFVQSYVMGNHPSRKDFNEFRDEIRGVVSERDGIIDKYKNLSSDIDALKEFDRKIENHLFLYRGKLKKTKRERKLTATNWSQLLYVKEHTIRNAIVDARKKRGMIIAKGGIEAHRLIETLKDRKVKDIKGNSIDVIDKIKRYMESDYNAAFLRNRSSGEWAKITGISKSQIHRFYNESDQIHIFGQKNKHEFSPEGMIESLNHSAEKNPIYADALIKFREHMEKNNDTIFTPEIAQKNYDSSN